MKKRKLNPVAEQLVVAIIILAFLTLVAILNSWANHYTLKGECIAVEPNGLCIVEDSRGEVWEMYADDLEVGELVEVKFYTNLTDDIINDDELVGFEKIQQKGIDK